MFLTPSLQSPDVTLALGVVRFTTIQLTAAQLAGVVGFYLVFASTTTLEGGCANSGLKITSGMTTTYGFGQNCDESLWPGVGRYVWRGDSSERLDEGSTHAVRPLSRVDAR